MSKIAVSDRSPERAANRRALLQALLDGGTVSRVDLAVRTGLSRPTVNAIVNTLEDEGLVLEVGAVSSSGRAAAIYRVATDARVVVGIDLGGSTIRGAVADLGGQIRASRDIPTRRADEPILPRLVNFCGQLLAEAGVRDDAFASIALGVPGAPNLLTGRIDYAVSIPELESLDLRVELSRELGVPVAIDNDVNMAVAGERWRGRAQHTADAVFIAVGNGLGVGIVSGGRLQRGHSGLSGEIDALPLRRLPTHERLEPFSLEAVVASAGIVAAWSDDPSLTGADVPRVFEAAKKGDENARAALDQSAWYLAQTIAVLQGVLDPERVIVGGGVGSHPLLMNLLYAQLERLRRRPPVVEASALEGRAALYGAIAVALAEARASVGLDPSNIVTL